MEFMLEVPFFDGHGTLVATRKFDEVPRTYAIPVSSYKFGINEVTFVYFVRRFHARGVFFVPVQS
jgi:hypothetical protein